MIFLRIFSTSKCSLIQSVQYFHTCLYDNFGNLLHISESAIFKNILLVVLLQ